MIGDGDPFLEACGAAGPPELEWDHGEAGGTARRAFDRPAILVGRGPRPDLALEHPLVSKRHAYLQMIDGRLFAVDLESRDGLRWSGVPRRSGWVDRRRPVQVGPSTLRVVGGGRAGDEEPGAVPGPLSRRYVPGHRLPGAVLEVRGAGDGAGRGRWAMDRALVLVGSSPHCKVRLRGPGASRYACGLVRTPRGVWMVDLLSSRGVAVNGVACRHARLEDGDVLGVGGETVRLTYEGPATAPAPPAAAGPGDPAFPIALLDPASWAGRPSTDPGREAWELIPETILRQLPGRDGPAPDAPPAPSQHALLMLIRLLGEMHRDHLEVVRDEMEQIRRLNREMGSLRARPGRPGDDGDDGAGPRPALPGEVEEGPPPLEDPALGRPDPRAVQALVGRRLADWERERQGRWKKVIDLLVKP